MNNTEFIYAIENSFVEFIKSGTSRSTRKLAPLHGAIAMDMQSRLGGDYSIWSQGFRNNKEGTIAGRYINKKVDISIFQNGQPVCGIAVKFVMQNYSQNSNNYFENMLGETANIRSARCPYFQIFIIPERLPYYEKDGTFKHWETFSENNIHKYSILDGDNPDLSFHSPNKTLIYILRLPEVDNIGNKDSYRNFFMNRFAANGERGFIDVVSPVTFDNSVILNDYSTFAEKIYHAIKAL